MAGSGTVGERGGVRGLGPVGTRGTENNGGQVHVKMNSDFHSDQQLLAFLT